MRNDLTRIRRRSRGIASPTLRRAAAIVRNLDRSWDRLLRSKSLSLFRRSSTKSIGCALKLSRQDFHVKKKRNKNKSQNGTRLHRSERKIPPPLSLSFPMLQPSSILACRHRALCYAPLRNYRTLALKEADERQHRAESINDTCPRLVCKSREPRAESHP